MNRAGRWSVCASVTAPGSWVAVDLDGGYDAPVHFFPSWREAMDYATRAAR